MGMYKCFLAQLLILIKKGGLLQLKVGVNIYLKKFFSYPSQIYYAFY